MDFREAVVQLEALVRELERDGDERALHLLQLVDAIHRPALERLANGESADPLVQALLAMYDLAPVDESLRVEEALDVARADGLRVEVVAVEDGVVRARLDNADRVAAEEALAAGYDGFRRLEVVAALRSVPLPLAAPEYVGVEDVDPGELKQVRAGGVAIVLAGVEDEVFAFRNECAVDGMPLDGGRLTGTILVCPWHNCAYDARSGARLDGEAGQLRVVPVTRRDGAVLVAV
jgi:nitrite reductase/ring-hydroxylating ferredoxin subunit